MYDWPIIKEIVTVFSWLLEQIYQVIRDYGWSIVVLTVIFRALMLPLDIKSKLSMKKQAALQPKIAKINEKYKNDKEKAAQKTMELYKQEKTSPLSGCLPALVQWPLFIAFFGALNIMAGHQLWYLYQAVITHGVDYAQTLIQPWLWVHNVWAPDTFFFGTNGINLMGLNSAVIPGYSAVLSLKEFHGISAAQYDVVMGSLIARNSVTYNGWFILPLLAGVTSWWQTKITMPPQQAAATQPKGAFNPKMMQYLFPLISVFFTASSNSVFALYWITSNILSIATYKGVDMVWKARDKRKEHEEDARHEEEAVKIAAAPKEKEGKRLEAGANKARGGAAKPAPEGKQGSKEGKK
jgi:YidC/Oxa1 family membrane protein insertase